MFKISKEKRIIGNEYFYNDHLKGLVIIDKRKHLKECEHVSFR